MEGPKELSRVTVAVVVEGGVVQEAYVNAQDKIDIGFVVIDLDTDDPHVQEANTAFYDFLKDWAQQIL